MKNKQTTLLAAILLSWSFSPAGAQTALTSSEMKTMTTQTNGSVVSIHDPSVVYRDGMFYIWGSHLGVARSNNLINFTGLVANNQTFAKPDGMLCDFNTAFNEQAVKTVVNYKGETVDFPQIDGEAWCSWYAADKQTWVAGDMWAPDIVYNETMGKWCMYLSLNGDNWSSVIILLTAPSATGPFTYQGPVVMGGFTGGSHKDGNGNYIAAPSYKNTDMAIAIGAQSSLPARYNQGGSWGTFWPNCIDPCVFFDEEGELWMAYGSWSGGIFMLKLDKTTGLRDYTYTYPSEYESKGANGLSDPYFGKKIAGGYYVSGEGPYIQHIGQYYYLFMSYGGFAPDGGYEMRLFRSKNPDGPYVDAQGTLATYTGGAYNVGPGATTNRGLKLLGAYNGWGLQDVGECAQGHNSACQDGKGRSFVVYHTKFNDGTFGHQVRVHQLFLNSLDWLVCAPFCYRGETTTDADIATTAIPADEVVGTYHFMLHPYKMDHANFQEITPTEITLEADGTVTGAQTGTWEVKEGTSYITLRLGTVSYFGVLVEQEVNGATTRNYMTSPMKALAFTAVATNGVPIWGYKLKPKYSVAWNYVNNTIAVKNGYNVSKNLSLMFPTTDNAVLKWTSSEPDVISETGKYAPREEAVPVTLTARLSCGDYYWEDSYDVTAQRATTPSGDYLTGMLAYYNMDESPCYNAYNSEQRTRFLSAGSGVKPDLTSDYDRFGQVVHQYFGDQKNCSYTRMENPLYGAEGLTGFTVSMWVKRTDANQYDALWGFFNSTSASASGPRLFLTGNNYMGYNDNASEWFDINHPVNGTYTDIPVGTWTLVTVTVGPDGGVRTYINGTSKVAHAISASSGVTKVKELPIANVVAKVASMRYFYLGLGSFWGSADCYFDDVMIYNREMSASDVRALNTMANRVTDFSKGTGTGIQTIMSAGQESAPSGIYDLQGRRVANPSRGLYIVNGKKILIK